MTNRPAVDTIDEHTELIPEQEMAQSMLPGTPITENQVGPYTIERLIGEGGGGTVYAARHSELGRRVAIKVLRAELARFPNVVTRFVREAVTVNKIRHPNIVEILEFGEAQQGRPYYVMELLDGVDLRKLLELHGRFSPKEVLDLLGPVCLAVQAAHDAGIIHRDLKASNVLVANSNGERVIKLLDFGIAKMVHGESNGQGLTEPGARLGTAQNMAPEQVRCEKLDARTDIYALGVVIFQLLTGQYPFEAEDPRQIAWMHLQAPPPRPSALAPVSFAVDDVVLRCLEKSPDRRYASMNELLQALRNACGDTPASADEQALGALALYFELTSSSQEDLTDSLVEELDVVLEDFSYDLGTRGFVFPLRTASTLLAVQLLEPGADPTQQRQDASAWVEELRAQVADRLAALPGMRLDISLTVDQAQCQTSGPTPEIVGGPILDVGVWATSHRVLSHTSP